MAGQGRDSLLSLGAQVPHQACFVGDHRGCHKLLMAEVGRREGTVVVHRRKGVGKVVSAPSLLQSVLRRRGRVLLQCDRWYRFLISLKFQTQTTSSRTAGKYERARQGGRE